MVVLEDKMAKQSVGTGTTGRVEYIYVIDSLSSTGLGKTNISFNTSGLNGHYVRSAGTAVTITFVSQTATGSWTSGGWAEVDATRISGIYRVDLPDAIFAAGSDKAIVVIKGVSNTIPVTLEYQITGTDPSIQIPSSAAIANTVWTNASRTITGGIADTVTTLTNRSGFAITGNIDKTGYSLSQSFPANFASLLISSGRVSIVQSDVNAIIGSIPEVNYSGIAATTWNFLASAVGNTSSIGYRLVNNLDVPVSSRSTLTSQQLILAIQTGVKQVISAIQASTRSVAQVNKDRISKL